MGILCQTMQYISKEWLLFGNSSDVFWYTVGATFLVHVTLLSSICRTVLTSTLAQWLGRISFGLYLTHIPLLYTLTCEVFSACLSSGFSYTVSAFVACALSSCAMLVVADIFTRFADQPGLRWSAVMGKWLLGSD